MDSEANRALITPALEAVALTRRLPRLSELASNLWWSWHPEAQGLFKEIDPILWHDTYHNPVKFLRQVKRKTLNAALHNRRVLELYDRTLAAFDAYLHPASTWYSRTH